MSALPEAERRVAHQKIVIGIATAGRGEILSAAILRLAQQKRRPDLIVVCPASPRDFDPATVAGSPIEVRVVQGDRGTTFQRNAIIRAVPDADLIAFFDDDFFPADDYLAATEAHFSEHPDTVVVTGDVLADGIGGPGLTVDDAVKLLRERVPGSSGAELSEVYNGYGCNMVVKAAPLREHGVSFDEELPLYAWWEDVDFSRRLAPFGKIVKSSALVGVHLGAKSGRTSGTRLGYSQVANPIYLVRKGSVSRSVAARKICENLAANARGFFVSEPWIDRRGRALGNFWALRDWWRGRLHPGNILGQAFD